MKYFLLFFTVLCSMFLISCQTDEQLKLDLLLKGNEYLEGGDFKRAIKSYTGAIQLDQEFVDAYNNRGVAYFESGSASEALADYNKAIELKPEYIEAIFNRSNALVELGRFEKAHEDLDKVGLAFPDTSTVYFAKGLVYSKSGHYKLSLDEFMSASEIDPNNIEIPINLATAYYYLNDFENAESYLKNAIKLDSEHPNIFNLKSLIALKRQDYMEALDWINEALNKAPNDPYLINNRGFVYIQLDSLEKAETDINESLRIDPLNGWAYRNRGILMAEREQYEDAVRLLKRAFEDDQTIEDIKEYLVQALVLNDQLDEACDYVQNIQESPNFNFTKLRKQCSEAL
ncbi:MAG: tetratricopeptide repeat protein [Cyclobacteriaceae bacterium]